MLLVSVAGASTWDNPKSLAKALLAVERSLVSLAFKFVVRSSTLLPEAVIGAGFRMRDGLTIEPLQKPDAVHLSLSVFTAQVRSFGKNRVSRRRTLVADASRLWIGTIQFIHLLGEPFVENQLLDFFAQQAAGECSFVCVAGL